MDKLKYWCERIGVSVPETFRVRRAQITNEYNRPYRFVGYCRANDTLYYDRQLTDEDICHEMLHKKFKDFSEEAIRELTKIIIW